MFYKRNKQRPENTRMDMEQIYRIAGTCQGINGDGLKLQLGKEEKYEKRRRDDQWGAISEPIHGGKDRYATHAR